MAHGLRIDRETLQRVVADLVYAELVSARGHAPSRRLVDASGDIRLDAAGLGSDSLELLRLAGSLNEMFHLHETGCEDLLLADTRLSQWVERVASVWPTSSRRVTFRSSGTTGPAKSCPHTLDHLALELDVWCRMFAPQRIYAAVPAHHIYGFVFTVLLPERLGVPVVDIRQEPALCRDAEPGDLVVTTPDVWRYLIETFTTLSAATGISS